MLQFNAVPGITLDVLKKLMRQSWISNFNLVGGTALALYWGHRTSEDIDFFTDKKINLDELESKINNIPGAKFLSKNPIGRTYLIDEIKCDFVNYPYRFFHPVQMIDGIGMAHIEDIISLKLGAIANRGAKKDFYDLYYIFQHYTIEQLVNLYKKKFNAADILPLLKSIVYFGDAETDLPPELLKDKQLTRPQVKKFIEQKVHEQVR